MENDKRNYQSLCNNCGEYDVNEPKRVVPDGEPDSLSFPEVWCSTCRTFWKHKELPDLTCDECGKMVIDLVHKFNHLRMRHGKTAAEAEAVVKADMLTMGPD